MTRRRGGHDDLGHFVPDSEGPEPRYDEPDQPPPDDRMPKTPRTSFDGPSRAELRVRAERLLLHREAADPEAWAALGPEVRQLLPRLLDDVAIRRNEAVLQKLMATLGQLGIPDAIPRLGEMLSDRRESATTRAYAANALGSLANPHGVPWLARAVADKDEMVRRQVARALGAIDHPDAVGHLMTMSDDASPEVARTAAAALIRYEERSGIKLGARRRATPRIAAKRAPATDSAIDRKRPR